MTASGDFSSRLWCATTGKSLFECKHKHVVKTCDFSNDTLKFVTGCQDGIIRIFDVCSLSNNNTNNNYVTEINSCINNVVDPVTRVHWGDKNNNDLIVVGRKSGFLELYDLRCNDNNNNKPIKKQLIVANHSIIDIELTSTNTNNIMIACEKQVCMINLCDLNITRNFIMPDNMSFSEEGGVSIHPDRKTFMAVILYFILY